MSDELGLSYHDKLNPFVWDGDRLEPEIRNRLLEIAKLFQQYLDLPKLKVYDIILTGSMANYNYSRYSDFDLHLVVNPRDVDGDIVEKFLRAKKDLWNDQHDITIRGYDVELYAQDISESHASTGVYSLLKDRWLVKPKYQAPDVNHSQVVRKADYYKKVIDALIASDTTDLNDIQRVKDKIKNMRQTGLRSQGEFSTENLAFKVLRNQGYLERLWDFYDRAVDRRYTMEQQHG
jgi:hypothetical protein